jgi:hypothetical protein
VTRMFIGGDLIRQAVGRRYGIEIEPQVKLKKFGMGKGPKATFETGAVCVSLSLGTAYPT